MSEVSAAGLRTIVDLRQDLKLESIRRHMRTYSGQQLGLVYTLRWADPEDKGRPVRLDRTPTAEEERRALDTLAQLMNTPESRQLAGRIWVQFYNEVAGGPGTIEPADADALYDFATRAALRLRAEAPHIRIIGPALTGLSALEENHSPGSVGEYRRDGLLRAIRWSIANADAVDLHLHCAGGEDAAEQLARLRRALHREGRPDLTVHSLEWSAARFPAGSADLSGAQQAISDIFEAMCAARVGIGAYSSFPKGHLKDMYTWSYLWDQKGQPHEPFFSHLKSIAGQNAPAAQSQARGGVSTDAPAARSKSGTRATLVKRKKRR
ncbi:MAG: hypothetical protein KJZ69_11440 [Phycisphaerales bacterium]|nr:hypothetical protein [Phycisphaerales bacterium]